MAERITGADFDKKVKNADGLVLLDFYSDSCIPCKQLSPVLGELEEAYAGKAAVYKVNVNYEEALSAEYRVMSAPTLILFQNGEPVDRKSGMQKKGRVDRMAGPLYWRLKKRTSIIAVSLDAHNRSRKAA